MPRNECSGVLRFFEAFFVILCYQNEIFFDFGSIFFSLSVDFLIEKAGFVLPNSYFSLIW